MTLKDTYYIEYDNGSKSAWLNSTDVTGFDGIVEKTLRMMLVADDGKILTDTDGNDYGGCLWLKDPALSVGYFETEPPKQDQNDNSESKKLGKMLQAISFRSII